ncbi:phosphatidylinositol-glycan biosynthesis class X protein [Melanotaenia boesemani]|uniref:phosphatidylinositol-glycan biosynthesis class X protein n=1 Tax=Melanotaenia boesemani TaxID=1250792 RepID=UPI001C052C2D|nr:phosphatidylinositol-glycan biosynthesis class X protein [Melanotaenia boesemani]
MYLALFTVLACLWTCHCLVEKDEEQAQDHCGLLKQYLEASTVSVELTKRGFHRDLINTVELGPDTLGDVRVLLVHRWPSGVYVDPYQLAFMSDQRDWQILFDSTIDLEMPAHKTSGFLTYIYPSYTGPTPTILKVTIPVHGRYHEPSSVGEMFTSVYIDHPELLLRTEKCAQLNLLEPHTVVDAPCTVNNSSTCSWVRVHQQQELGPLSFQLPVGDGSAVVYICGGTLLATMICCAALSKYMWKHQII